MKQLRCLFAWSFFFGFLAAVGAGVFHFVRYRPRCVIEAKNESFSLQHLSEDGNRLVVCRWPLSGVNQTKKPEERAYQPRLEVFDTKTGNVVYTVENFAAESDWGGITIHQSPDHRYFVGNRTESSVLVDWQAGQHWTIETGRKVRRDPQTGELSMRHEREDALTGDSMTIEIGADCRSIPWSFSPNSRWLTSSGQVLDPATRQVVRSFSSLQGFTRKDSQALVILSGEKLALCLWDMDNHRVAWTVPTDLLDNSWRGFLTSDDGRWLVIADTSKNENDLDRPHINSDRELRFRSAEVWDLFNKKRKLHLVEKDRRAHYLLLPRDGSRLAVWAKGDNEFALSLIDLDADGDELTRPLRSPLRIKHQGQIGRVPDAQWGLFAPRNDLFAFAQFYEGNQGQLSAFTMCDAATNRELWLTRSHCMLDFSPNGKWVSCAQSHGSIKEKLDARSGISQGKSYWSQGESQSRDGQLAIGDGENHGLPEGAFWDWIREHLPPWLLPSNDSVTVVETETGRERLRVRLDDQYATRLDAAQASTHMTLLSGDGSALMSVYQGFDNAGHEGGALVRVWDVNPHRAYGWSIASSVALGIVLLLFRHWRLRRKARA